MLVTHLSRVGELDGNLNLGPLVPLHGVIIVEESRFTSGNPFILGFESLSESVNAKVKQAVGECAILSNRDIGGLCGV